MSRIGVSYFSSIQLAVLVCVVTTTIVTVDFESLATEQPSSQSLLEEAKILGLADYEKAKATSLQFIEQAVQANALEDEWNGRFFIVDLIKRRGFANDLALYKQQLDKLNDLSPVQRPDMNQMTVLLDLARAELFIVQRQPHEAHRYATKALDLANSNVTDLIPSALLLRGISLTIELFDKFNVSKDDKETEQAFGDLSRALDGWIHPAFEANKVDAQLTLAVLSLIRGEQENAQRFFEKANPPPSSLLLPGSEGKLSNFERAICCSN